MQVVYNRRIFQEVQTARNLIPMWWNPKIFTLLMGYNYLVLALKLLFCVPELRPLFLDWTTAGPDPHCLYGTEGCELITETLV